MTDRGFKPRALGEIAIRCAGMGKMARFYEDIIGLDRLSGADDDPIVFFRIAEGFGGHTAVLALFCNAATPRPGLHPTAQIPPETGPRSSLHHLALTVPHAEQDAVMAWYDRHDQPYRIETFGWVGWRGIFTQDPEGNTVELVAYHAAFKDPS
ncbi:VOC family protein [Actibacterium sp. 188UL27-1]|nr:VOC family protein [Actibacterium sp. 188UL27-1]